MSEDCAARLLGAWTRGAVPFTLIVFLRHWQYLRPTQWWKARPDEAGCVRSVDAPCRRPPLTPRELGAGRKSPDFRRPHSSSSMRGRDARHGVRAASDLALSRLRSRHVFNSFGSGEAARQQKRPHCGRTLPRAASTTALTARGRARQQDFMDPMSRRTNWVPSVRSTGPSAVRFFEPRMKRSPARGAISRIASLRSAAG